MGYVFVDDKQHRLSFFMPGADRVHVGFEHHHPSWILWIQ
jgi:hypothetical protein